jgi:hypothetical protein
VTGREWRFVAVGLALAVVGIGLALLSGTMR